MLFRMIAAVGLSLLLFGPVSAGHAQEPASDPYRISLKSRSFTPPEEVRLESVLSDVQSTRVHILVQFRSLPSSAVKRSLEDAGIKLLNYIPNSSWFASIPTNL